LVAELRFLSHIAKAPEEISMTWTKILVCALLVLAVPVGGIRAQSAEENTVEAASDVLRDIMAIPVKAIPEALLAEAEGVAIIPGMLKGGFIFGVHHGKGVVLQRNASGAWTAPVFITVTGGSIGWQAGVQSTDVIFVFRNRRGVEGLMRGKFTIGADAAVAAGPVGRQASAATDAQLKAEILSYSRSRGLFAGVAIDGAVMQVDRRANAAYYAPRPGQPEGCVPAPAIKLVEQIASYAGARNKTEVNVMDVPLTMPPPQIDEVEAVRSQLAASSLRLHGILEPQWKEFLALPADVYAQGKTPPKDALDNCLGRYNVVINDGRYQSLSARPEFQETHGLLLRYRSALEANKSGTLKLPPPPK
jgi:SH3 domain-containing YSC84-like protein 1